MDLNFDELIRPYNENGRTTELQITWLRKKGFSSAVIESAIQDIYAGLHQGITYPNGHELDQALLKHAHELANEESRIILNRLERVNLPGGRFKKAWRALRGQL
jgi:DNA topoisomerase IA